MSKFADYFATVKNGKIATLTSSTPPHELKPNQFSISKDEFDLLHAIPVNRENGGIDIDKAMNMLAELKKKIWDIQYAKS